MAQALSTPEAQRGWPTNVQLDEFVHICPEGVSPPAEIPADIFAMALNTLLDCQRVDMQSLAAQLGISRATLYRRVKSRDHLLGQVLWFLTRVAMARALPSDRHRPGVEQVVLVIERFMHDIHGQPALRRLLEAEPEIALRILTSKHGPVQQGITAVLQRLLERELGSEGASVAIEAATLAFVIVRIGESFLYADVIADHEPDIEEAVKVIAVLLRSSTTCSCGAPRHCTRPGGA